MPYDRFRHHRRSFRLRGRDYAHSGAYFVTVCTHRRECVLAEVIDGTVHLSAEGEIVCRCWHDLPAHYPHVVLDAFVIMPNHVHGIIILTEGDSGDGGTVMLSVGAQHAAPLPVSDDEGRFAVKPRSLGAIVRSFKSAATREINMHRETPGAPVWQRNYYERTVRNGHELGAVREYIHRNPYHWVEDPDNPENIA